MTNLLRYSPLIVLFFIYISEGQPARFCSRLTRDCTTECRENGTSPLFDCVVDCTCDDLQIAPLLSYEECVNAFDEARDDCRGRSCSLSRIVNTFCSSLPGRCCDPNELDFVECIDNSTEPLCCDGEWICPSGFSGRFSCSERLISTACCCDATDDFNCPGRLRRACCPNDGQYTCPTSLPFLGPLDLYACSDGNLYSSNEMADECCCDPYEQPGRFGNLFCTDGVVCCPDGTWSCGIGNGLFTCGGESLHANQLTQGEVCTCEAPQECIQVLICCDGIVYPTPCDAQAACYDTSPDSEFCTYQFNFLGNGFCSPREFILPFED